MWAAGPPNAVAPSIRKSFASSKISARVDRSRGGGSAARAVTAPGFPREQRVQGDLAGPRDDQEQRSEPHAEVHARLVHHTPEAGILPWPTGSDALSRRASTKSGARPSSAPLRR